MHLTSLETHEPTKRASSPFSIAEWHFGNALLLSFRSYIIQLRWLQCSIVDQRRLFCPAV
jgi:hypothetical protein